MTTDSRPSRRRRRTSGVLPAIPGNEMFTRIQEELELYLSPRRAAEVLDEALRGVGASPRDASFGHMVQLVDIHLKRALQAACTPDEAEELHKRVVKVLDELASQFFHKP